MQPNYELEEAFFNAIRLFEIDPELHSVTVRPIRDENEPHGTDITCCDSGKKMALEWRYDEHTLVDDVFDAASRLALGWHVSPLLCNLLVEDSSEDQAWQRHFEDITTPVRYVWSLQMIQQYCPDNLINEVLSAKALLQQIPDDPSMISARLTCMAILNHFEGALEINFSGPIQMQMESYWEKIKELSQKKPDPQLLCELPDSLSTPYVAVLKDVYCLERRAPS